MNKREEKKSHFSTFDGEKLVYRSWTPSRDSVGEKKALIVIHRGHEHSGRLIELIEGINQPECWAFGYDSRGHGESGGPRGYAPSFSHIVKDLDTFVKFISKEYQIKIENIFIVANSVGAVVASAWVHDYAPNIRGMALAAPAFEIKLYVPLALSGCRLLDAVKHPAYISSYVKSKFLTHDPVEQKKYDEDKLITPQIAVNILVGLHDTSERVVKDAGAIHVPTIVFSAGSDWVVKNGPQKTFFDNLSSKKKEFIVLDGFYHGVLYEKDRQLPFGHIHRFINECFNASVATVDMIAADKQGYTYNEYKTIQAGDVNIFNKINYAIQVLSMKTLGMLSVGIRIGYKYGFDSGISLDHVYKNKARGEMLIGKIIDFFYINAVGWKGIRARRVHMRESLNYCIDELIKEGKPVRIMDIGSGPGRYLLETAKKYEKNDIKVLLRDYSDSNIKEAQEIAKDIGCTNAEFKVADAFDPNTYKEQAFKPNILIVSGLFELFPSNETVLKAVNGATSILEKDGFIVYTGQPWHPQLEMIAHTLPNREGVNWVMRRRTQLEIDQIFAVNGADKLDMKIDQWGIFTVATAKFKKSA
ncbi:MAG: bifunctional alpha/beta hydrolase/class I SAM-dependent methyltransferase [Bacteriovorax sp.]|jgi:alpha-beta hydrolase superfamily lysophospholipase/SAM-dependent methyltransferase